MVLLEGSLMMFASLPPLIEYALKHEKASMLGPSRGEPWMQPFNTAGEYLRMESHR